MSSALQPNPAAGEGATVRLARYVVETNFKDLPPRVIHEAKRSLVNVCGVAIGAARHEAMDIVLQLAHEVGGTPQVTVWGRPERADLMYGALLNGMACHIFDYDDTHPTILHPSAPVAPVALSLAEALGRGGRDVLTAFVLGVEVASRVSNSVSPWHIENGFHPTSTTGHFGATAAAGKLLGLTVEQLAVAFGLAGTQAAGVLESLGTMAKPFHPGKAAFNGIMAAKLAKLGFTASTKILEADKGFARVLSPQCDLARLTAGLGEVYELLDNSYKPFACGIVAHPSIDGAIRLREQYGIKPEQVEKIECTVNDFTLVPMGRRSPQNGLESKFSAYHAVAVGLVDGTAGEAQFSDERAVDPTIVALRDKIEFKPTPAIRKDEAVVAITLTDGRRVEVHVEHARGSKDNPLTDEQLSRKFREVASMTLPEEKVENALAALWALDQADDLSAWIAAVQG